MVVSVATAENIGNFEVLCSASAQKRQGRAQPFCEAAEEEASITINL